MSLDNIDRIVLSDEGNKIMEEENVHVRLAAKHREIHDTIANLTRELIALKLEVDTSMKSDWDTDQAYAMARARAETEAYIRNQADGGCEYYRLRDYVAMVTPNILVPHDEVNFGTSDDTCWSVWFIKEGRAFLVYGERMNQHPTQTCALVMQRALKKFRDKEYEFPVKHDPKNWVEMGVVRKAVLGHEPNWT